MNDALDLKYVRGSVVNYPPGATFGPRHLGDYELVWIVEGDVLYHSDGQTVQTPAGSVFVCLPGSRDAITWDRHRRTRHAFVHFDINRMPSHWPPHDAWPTVRVLPDDDIVRPLFRYVLSNWAISQGSERLPPKSNINRAMEVMLEAFIFGESRQYAESDPDYPPAVAKALYFIHETLSKDPATPLDLDQISKVASVSPSHLCRQFRKVLDAGPAEVVRVLRLDIAVQLLARSNLSVSEIAYRCGFASADHFSRRFRKQFGVPPAKLRKQMLEGQPPPITPLVRHVHQMRS